MALGATKHKTNKVTKTILGALWPVRGSNRGSVSTQFKNSSEITGDFAKRPDSSSTWTIRWNEPSGHFKTKSD